MMAQRGQVTSLGGFKKGPRLSYFARCGQFLFGFRLLSRVLVCVFLPFVELTNVVYHRKDDCTEYYKRETDPLKSVLEQTFKTSIFPHHGCEKTADKEEQWHSEAVDGNNDEAIDVFVLVDVLSWPNR